MGKLMSCVPGALLDGSDLRLLGHSLGRDRGQLEAGARGREAGLRGTGLRLLHTGQGRGQLALSSDNVPVQWLVVSFIKSKEI